MRTTSRGHDEAGFTVIELAVTLLVMAVASVIITGFLTNTTTTSKRVGDTVTNERDAQFVVRSLTQELRAANPLRPCGASSTGFMPGYGNCIAMTVPRPTASFPNCTSTITYGRAGAFLKEDRTDTNCGLPQNRLGRTLVAVQNTTTNLFEYYDGSGNMIGLGVTCSTNPTAPPCPTGASSVRLTVELKPAKSSVPSATFSSLVTIRNRK